MGLQWLLLPYEERLKKLKLISLVRRQERGNLIETFTILKNLEGIKSEGLSTPEIYGGLRGHLLKLFRRRLHLDVRKYFLPQRVTSA